MLCPECGGRIESTDGNEYYCKGCGLVMKEFKLTERRMEDERNFLPKQLCNFKQTLDPNLK